MNLEEIKKLIENALIREHRHSGIELKSEWKEDNGKKVCGLANKLESGSKWLVVGIDDEGCICNKSEAWAKANEETISQSVNRNLDPMQAVKHIDCFDINNSWLIAIEIIQPGDVVYWSQKPYKMAGTTLEEMKPEEAIKLRLQLPGLIDYSKQQIDSEYDLKLVEGFVKAGKTNIGSGIQALKTMDIYGTQVSRILFGNCSFRVVKFDLHDNPVSNEEFKGLYRILENPFIEDLQEWAKSNTGNKSDLFSSVALKEALANAVAHAAYYESDGDIIIEVYPEKICISNLCTKEAQFFANKWFSRKHKTLNGLLMEILRYCGAVDELGLGKTKIISESIQRGHQIPEVIVEKGSRYERWKIWIFGGKGSKHMLRILDQCKTVFGNNRKSLIAVSLVYWKGKSLDEVKEFVEGELAKEFAEVIDEFEGPVWYSNDSNKIILSRWTRIALEGHDTKAFEPQEEERLKKRLSEHAKKNWDGIITPKKLKRFADVGSTASASSYISRLLKKWCEEGVIHKSSKGKYKVGQKVDYTLSPSFVDLMRIFSDIPTQPPEFQGDEA